MAIEGKRGCGYRKVNGLYLCGDGVSVPCDRLPYLLEPCPTCGQGIKQSRAFTAINPLKLFGFHTPCADIHRPCWFCDPVDELSYLLWVGERHYTPESFQEEANRMGVSKRIPFIPKGLKLGETIIFLAHPQACTVTESAVLQQALAVAEPTNAPKLLEADRVVKKAGIFSVFRPRRIEQLITKSKATKETKNKLKKRGITPIVVPDNDPDHCGGG